MSRHTNPLLVSVVLIALSPPAGGQVEPPFTDYCEMLEQEVQDRKHGFLAGNLVYYIGGAYGVWNKDEDETIGLTHPFFHDLRSRGHGMAQHEPTGFGHDLQGWEFYRHVRAAYGSVIVDGKSYRHPAPTSMVWRPDRMICEYTVGGVQIREDKFIADNDVACTIITSSAPVTLEFEGDSLVVRESVSSSASCSLVDSANTVHVLEGGRTLVHPANNVTLTGDLVYDGMSTLVSASRPLTDYSQSQSSGQCSYSFQVSCDRDGVAVVWAMDDVYENAQARVDEVLADPAGKLAEKTDFMNDLLNEQIPYFRCSDQDIVDIYYFLWALYFMYFIDVGEGWEAYPHTQTAVNNFLGMHRYDAVFQNRIGAWTVDKETYANGNILLWKALLPFAQGCGMLPDNMGIAWHSGIYGPSAIAHVPQAWLIYEHSGDTEFLAEAYAFYKALFWNGACEHWGYVFEAGESLEKMADVLGFPGDKAHWRNLLGLNNISNWLNNRWETDTPSFFLNGEPTMNWSAAAYMAIRQFPEQWAREMSANWLVNQEDGFFGQVPLLTVARQHFSQISRVFTVTPDTNWYALRGMYIQHVDGDANRATLAHLKGYNHKWGIPTAPESLDINFEPWGDQYSNFNAGKILLILEGILGLSYSVVDDHLTISDHLPHEWLFMETYVPIHENDVVEWTQIRVERSLETEGLVKTVSVAGNSRADLVVEPWLEERELVSSEPAADDEPGPTGHRRFTFSGVEDATVTVTLEDVNREPTAILLTKTSIPENQPPGSLVGILDVVDSDVFDTHDFAFSSGAGDDDNASFAIDGDRLETAEEFDFESRSSYSIRLVATDPKGGTIEQNFTVSVQDIFEDDPVAEDLLETFTGPGFDLESYWQSISGGGTFTGEGQYRLTTTSGNAGLRGEIGSGDFTATLEIHNIDWTADFAKVVWEIRDDSSNWVIFFIEKGDSWMSLLVDLFVEGSGSRQIQKAIPVPNSATLRVEWTEATKEWRFWYGLDGDSPTTEAPGSPITSYTSPSKESRFMNLLVGQWRTGAVTADLDRFSLETPSEPPADVELQQVTPNSGSAAGGDTISLLGANFVAATEVEFGEAVLSEVTFISAAELEVLSPPGEPGAVDVVVRNPDGSSDTLSAAFTYGPVDFPPPVVSAIVPGEGPEDGGEWVTLVGSELREGVRVFFGQTEALSVVYRQANDVGALAPPGTGTVDVTVRNEDGQEGVLPGGFLYLPAATPFLRGDCDANGEIDLADPLTLVFFLFVGSAELPCHKSGDIDDDGALGINDVIKLLDFEFRAGPPPAPPLGICGPDGVEDDLPCEAFAPCEE